MSCEPETKCPYCNSENIEEQEPDIDNEIWFCFECDEIWYIPLA